VISFKFILFTLILIVVTTTYSAEITLAAGPTAGISFDNNGNNGPVVGFKCDLIASGPTAAGMFAFTPAIKLSLDSLISFAGKFRYPIGNVIPQLYSGIGFTLHDEEVYFVSGCGIEYKFSSLVSTLAEIETLSFKSYAVEFGFNFYISGLHPNQ
jgi:hypothetical protein